MPIHVEMQDERGSRVARYDGPSLGFEFLKLAPVDSACFRFIVLWGNTTFNEGQIEVLKEELRVASITTEHPTRKVELKALLDFLDQAIGVRNYVKFIGD
jgi:hypothetical protein